MPERSIPAMPALRSVAAKVLPFPANLCWRARSPRAFLDADGERRDAEDGKREADMQAAGEAGWIGRACCPGGPWASRTAERRPGWALSRLPTPAAGTRRHLLGGEGKSVKTQAISSLFLIDL
jgi:hypothetical protein